MVGLNVGNEKLTSLLYLVAFNYKVNPLCYCMGMDLMVTVSIPLSAVTG
jgi:hypothetical protein